MRRTLLLLLAALAAGPPAMAQGTTARVAVIAHRSVAADSLSHSQLLDFYAGDIQRWPDGTRVVVTDLKAKGAVRDGFYEYLGRRPSRMKSIWLRRMLSGEGDPPTSLDDEPALLRHVMSTPGALGYVHGDSVSDSVRVLLWIDLPDIPPPP
jgi:hypothetical protein